MQPQGETGLTEDFLMPIPQLSSANSPGIMYYSFTRDTPEEYPIGSFSCLLKFVSKEVDPSTGEPEEEGYEDEYQLEDTELSAADYIVPTYVTFASEWDRLRSGVNITETFSLPAMDSLKGEHMVTLLLQGQVAYSVCFSSGVRLDHRNSQYAAARWERRPTIANDALTTTVWAGCRRWRQGAGAVPDDLLEGPGSRTGTGCPRGKAGVGEPGCCRHTVELPWIMLPSILFRLWNIADFCMLHGRKEGDRHSDESGKPATLVIRSAQDGEASLV